jgi:hypothetical protein
MRPVSFAYPRKRLAFGGIYAAIWLLPLHRSETTVMGVNKDDNIWRERS